MYLFMYARMYVQSNRAPSERGSTDGKVFDRLASSGSDKQKAQDALDKKKEQLELSQCTFAPHIPQSEFIRPRSVSAKPVHIRLAEEAEKLREEQKKRAEQQAKEDLKTNTFQPHIPQSEFIRPRSVSAKPVHVRLAEEAEKLREEQKKREELQAKEERRNTTFTPQIPRKSLTLGSHSAIHSTIFDRLTKDAEKQRDEYKRRSEAKRQDEMKDVTFTPKIPLSAVKRPSIGTLSNGSIFDRLNAEAEKLKQQKQALQMQQQPSGFSFGSAPSSARKPSSSTTNTTTTATSNTNTASNNSLQSLTASTPRQVAKPSASVPASAVKPASSQGSSGPWMTKKTIVTGTTTTATIANGTAMTADAAIESAIPAKAEVVEILQPASEPPEASSKPVVTPRTVQDATPKPSVEPPAKSSSLPGTPTKSVASAKKHATEVVASATNSPTTPATSASSTCEPTTDNVPEIEIDMEQLKLDVASSEEGTCGGTLEGSAEEAETF